MAKRALKHLFCYNNSALNFYLIYPLFYVSSSIRPSSTPRRWGLMKKTASSFPSESVQALPSRKALRDLYRAARHIYHSDPYAAARLARIADQAEYFMQEWPLELWPSELHVGHPLPGRHVLLAWAAAAKRDATHHSLPASSSWSYANWHQVTTTLLAALVSFA